MPRSCSNESGRDLISLFEHDLFEKTRLPLCINAAPPGPGHARSIRSRHLEHGILPDFEIITPAPRTHDRPGQRGLIDAVPDHGLVDVDGDDLAEREPGLRLPAVGALKLDDLRHLAFK